MKGRGTIWGNLPTVLTPNTQIWALSTRFLYLYPCDTPPFIFPLSSFECTFLSLSFSGDLLYLLLHHSLGQIGRFPLFLPALTWKAIWACLHGSPFVLPLSFGLGIFSIISFLQGFYFFSSFLRFSPMLFSVLFLAFDFGYLKRYPSLPGNPP